MSGTLPDFKLPQHGRDHRPGGSDPISGVGDYVFIAEVETAEDDDTIVFDTIPQLYRHLVIEADVTVNAADQKDSLSINWNDLAGVFSWTAVTQTDMTPASTEGAGGDDIVKIPDLVAPKYFDDLQPSPGITAVTIKFPYYRAAGRTRAALWHATAMVLDGTPAFGTGGGQSIVDFHPAGDYWDTTAITKITLNTVSQGMGGGSIASLYGIR